VDLARITYYDALLRDGELARVNTAKHHDANTLDLLHTVPSLGQLRRRVLLDAIHHSDRFLRVQAFASDCRLVKCAKESAGTRSGTSGPHIGKAPLTWTFSAAAVLCLRHHPAGQKFLTRLEKKQSQGLDSLRPYMSSRRLFYGKKQEGF
jgi:hypothetical protein